MNTQVSDKNRLAYGIKDALAVVPISRSFLFEQIKEGHLKTFKVGSRTLIASEDLTAWLDSYRRNAA